MYVITKFDASHRCLAMVSKKGSYTLHADLAEVFEDFDAALEAVLFYNSAATPHYISAKPKMGFDGLNPM